MTIIFGDYRISDGSTATGGTGTISAAGASKNVTGSGTSFTTQLHAGDILLPNDGQILSVDHITDNTHLVLAHAVVAALSGATFQYDAMTMIESLAPMLAPKGSFQPYAEPFQLGNGRIRGGGLPTDSWTFSYLPKSARDNLRDFCTGASSAVYIRTRTIDAADSITGEDAFETFSAVVVWPLDETKDRPKGTRVPFVLTFRQLVTL